MMSLEYNTIIEANRNRFKEGARVLEDIARFIFRDRILFARIKKIKQTIKIDHIANANDHDIGGPTFIEDNHRDNLLELIHANALRMQEAARVLEELDHAKDYKTLRFSAYEIHRELVEKYNDLCRVKNLKGIYPICDPEQCSVSDMANHINQHKITICQLRMKRATPREIYHAAKKFKALLNNEVLLIINDAVDVALMTADGVHVGQDDLPVNDIRRMSPSAFIIGCSCHDLSEAEQAQRDGASYISLGAVFRSQTKRDATTISLARVHEIARRVRVPTCAIGGINSQNINKLHGTGVDMFAMHTGLWTGTLA